METQEKTKHVRSRYSVVCTHAPRPSTKFESIIVPPYTAQSLLPKPENGETGEPEEVARAETMARIDDGGGGGSYTEDEAAGAREKARADADRAAKGDDPAQAEAARIAAAKVQAAADAEAAASLKARAEARAAEAAKQAADARAAAEAAAAMAASEAASTAKKESEAEVIARACFKLHAFDQCCALLFVRGFGYVNALFVL